MLAYSLTYYVNVCKFILKTMELIRRRLDEQVISTLSSLHGLINNYIIIKPDVDASEAAKKGNE